MIFEPETVIIVYLLLPANSYTFMYGNSTTLNFIFNVS